MTTNYREILRLESLGLNKTDIASAAQCARNTVSTTLARAKAWNPVGAWMKSTAWTCRDF